VNDHRSNNHGQDAGPNQGNDASDGSFVFHRALHEDSPVADEGGPLSRNAKFPRNDRDDLAAGFPFEDADVLADLFLGDADTTVARIGPGGLQSPRSAPIVEPKPASPAKTLAAPAKPIKHTAPKADPVKPEPLIGADAGGTFIESLIVGHLPVLGSAWVMQYAKHRAQTAAKPVVLLRVSGADVSVDVAFPPASLPPNMGPMPSVADAIRHLKSISDQWIVRIDEAAEGMDAAELMRCLRASDRASVLTGADEAAVVACYRVIKTLGSNGPPLHVVVMGSSLDAAGDAAKKLSKAAEKFLGKSVSSEACSAKITPGSAANIYRGRPNLSHDRLIDLVRESVETRVPPARETTGGSGVPPVLESPSSVHRRDACATEQTEAESEAKETGTFAAPVPDAFPPAPVATAATAPAVTPPHSAAATPPSASSSAPTSLARHLPSLEPLEARCPYAPEVELAVDPSGRLHLIARSHANATDPHAAFSKLAVARTWALAHAALLEQAFRQAKPLAFAPEQHLLTDAPKRVRPLLDTDVRLHLLTAPAGTAETGPGWVCVELN
jgi:hypothetical protein